MCKRNSGSEATDRQDCITIRSFQVNSGWLSNENDRAADHTPFILRSSILSSSSSINTHDPHLLIGMIHNGCSSGSIFNAFFTELSLNAPITTVFKPRETA